MFCKIVKGEIPATEIYRDDKILVFKDANPVKPTHFLVIPTEHVADFTQVSADVLVAIKNKITDLINNIGLAKQGYRVEVNGGAAMGVPHLHFHLLAPINVAEKV